MTSTAWIPRTRGGRIRLVTLAFGLVLITLPGASLVSGPGNDGASLISGIAIGLLVAILLITSVIRRQITMVEGPATAVLAVLVGIGLQNPLAVTLLCVGVIVAQSMYGGIFSHVLRVVSFLPVIPASVSLSVSPVSDGILWYSASTLSLVPALPIYATLVYELKSALESQADAKRRARFMAGLTGDLLATTTLQQALPVLRDAAAEICRLTPGLVMVPARLDSPRGGPATATVRGIIGTVVENPPTEIPADIVAELPALGLTDFHEVKGVARRMKQIGLPPNLRWYAHGNDDLLDATTANLALFGIPTSPVERAFGTLGARNTELVDVLHSLAEHRATTFGYLLEKRTMMLAANRDDVTGLAKRSSFLHRLDDLLGDLPADLPADLAADQDRSVAMILIGLDGLTPLAVERGFPAATAAASRLARRLVDAVGEPGSIARFSDNRFAVALPVVGADDVTELAEAVRRALAEPIPIDGGPVSLAISIGIARAGTGSTSWDLAERAAVALRLDRETAGEPLMRTR